MEYYIQSGAFDGDRRQRYFQHQKSTAGSGDDPNAYFTAAVLDSVLFAAASRGGLLLFEKPILRFLGEDSSLLPLVITYMKPILYVMPVFSRSGACHLSFPSGAGLSSAGLSSCFAALLRLLFRMACHAADGACAG